jgi:hypothetical protein
LAVATCAGRLEQNDRGEVNATAAEQPQTDYLIEPDVAIKSCPLSVISCPLFVVRVRYAEDETDHKRPRQQLTTDN